MKKSDLDKYAGLFYEMGFDITEIAKKDYMDRVAKIHHELLEKAFEVCDEDDVISLLNKEEFIKSSRDEKNIMLLDLIENNENKGDN